nr:tetratricopeptide repeat-containing sensor histidine kinase [Chryseolinea sp.]
KKIGDSILIADNLDHLGAIHSFRKEYNKALPYHEEAISINTKIDNQFNLLINYANIGEVYMRIGNYQKGRTLLMTALTIGKKINANSVLIFVYYTLGECYSLMGEPTIALTNFSKSLELILQQGETRERPYVFNLMSEHFERNHDYAMSLQYFRKSSIERDSLSIASASYAMEELKTKYEVEKRERDLHSALLENNLKQAELEQTSQTINMLFVFIATAVIGLVITIVLVIKLSASEKKLKLANTTKDALLTIIGHDLRGPMRNINQLTNLIKLSEGQDREDAIKLLEKPVHAALHLLDDLLAWSRSARHESISTRTNINLSEVVHHAIELFRGQAASKQIQLKINIPNDVTAFADSNHVSSILRNLISNAIKFTPSGGEVIIDHKSENENVTVLVKDSGLGILPHHIEVILEGRFFSTHGTQNEKGSGFGLMLCQEFARLNDGRLSIESVIEKGSTISITLPAAKS